MDNANFSISNDEAAVTIDEVKKETNLYRNMFHYMNAKPDDITRIYTEGIIIQKEDIWALNNNIADKITNHYDSHGYIVTVMVKFGNKRFRNFSCWEEFRNYPWDETSFISSIILNWSFNLRLPQYEYPQKHTLIVKLSSGMKPEEMLSLILSGKIEDVDGMETDSVPVVARVEYVNSVLGEELLDIVEKWVKSQNSEPKTNSKILKLLKKHRKLTTRFFKYITLIMIYFLGIVLINLLINSFEKDLIKWTTSEITQVINSIALLLGVCLIANMWLKTISQKIYDSLTSFGQVYLFNITKGDQNKQNDIKDKDLKLSQNIAWKLIMSISFNLVCGIITTYICNKIFG